MKVALRGHIRDSFEYPSLYELLCKIRRLCGTIQIYIHTWNVVQSSLSYRKMAQNNTAVTETMIKTYFKDLSKDIIIIIIDDDKSIPLIGTTEGVMPNTLKTPLLSWKRYWFGKYRILEHMFNSGDDIEENAVNLRFDVLSNSNPISNQEIIKFIAINKDKKFLKNKFIRNTNGPGIDNIYMGSMRTLFILSWEFHNNLDSILNSTKCGQERMVFEKNDLVFFPN